jgi:hypothetical protein
MAPSSRPPWTFSSQNFPPGSSPGGLFGAASSSAAICAKSALIAASSLTQGSTAFSFVAVVFRKSTATQEISKMAENPSNPGSKKMIAIDDEMKRSIEQLCGPRDFHDTRESWLARGARRAGISYRAAKAFFYREKINPRATDVEAVRAAILKDGADNDRHRERASADEATIRAEIHDMLENLDRAVSRLEAAGLRAEAQQARLVGDRARSLFD